VRFPLKSAWPPSPRSIHYRMFGGRPPQGVGARTRPHCHRNHTHCKAMCGSGWTHQCNWPCLLPPGAGHEHALVLTAAVLRCCSCPLPALLSQPAPSQSPAGTCTTHPGRRGCTHSCVTSAPAVITGGMYVCSCAILKALMGAKLAGQHESSLQRLADQELTGCAAVMAHMESGQAVTPTLGKC